MLVARSISNIKGIKDSDIEQILVQLAHDEKVDIYARFRALEALLQLAYSDTTSLFAYLARDERLILEEMQELVQKLRAHGYQEAAIRTLLLIAADATRTIALQWEPRQAAMAALLESFNKDTLLIQIIVRVLKTEKTNPWLPAKVINFFSDLSNGMDYRYILGYEHTTWQEIHARELATNTIRELAKDGDFLLGLRQLAQLEEAENWLRCEAIGALSVLGQEDVGAIPFLGALIQKPEADPIRSAAVHAMAKLNAFKHAANLSEIIELATSPKADSTLREAAIGALACSGAENKVAEVLLQLAQDGSMASNLRLAAVHALNETGQREHAANQYSLLAQDENCDRETSVQAAIALVGLGKSDEAKQYLWMLVNDPGSELKVRRQALHALDNLLVPSDPILHALIPLVRDEKEDIELRQQIIKVLGRFKEDKVIRCRLAELLQAWGLHQGVRFECALLLDKPGDDIDAVIRGMVWFIQDRTVWLWRRIWVAGCLGRLDNKDEARHLLLEIAHQYKLGATDLTRISGTLEELGFFEDGLTLLKNSLHDPEIDQRYCVNHAEELIRRGHVYEAEQVLVEIAQVAQPDARVQAAEVLATRPRWHHHALTVFQTIAQDRQVADGKAYRIYGYGTNRREVKVGPRNDAINALGRFGHNGSGVAACLFELLRDENEGIRQDAYYALTRAIGNLRYAQVYAR